MKSDSAEAITHIDRQIGEFEELLKELTYSLFRLRENEASLASIKPVPRPPGERPHFRPILAPPLTEEEKREILKKQLNSEKFNASYEADRRSLDGLVRKYDHIYDDTEYLWRKYFPSDDDLKKLKEFGQGFRQDRGGAYPALSKECHHYIQASNNCLFMLRMYRRKIETFGVYVPQERIFAQGDLVMEKYHSAIGDVSNSTVSVALGKQNTIIATLNATSQTELAQALKILTDAVLASKSLSDDDKEEHVEMINTVGEEVTKPKPNKRKLKILTDGLLATLKAVPDVAKAVVAVLPVLNQLHL